MKNLFRRNQKVDPTELDRQTQEVREQLEREGPKMQAIVTYLERRKLQNGFGVDFEFTFEPRGS